MAADICGYNLQTLLISRTISNDNEGEDFCKILSNKMTSKIHTTKK